MFSCIFETSDSDELSSGDYEYDASSCVGLVPKQRLAVNTDPAGRREERGWKGAVRVQVRFQVPPSVRCSFVL